MVDLVGVGVEVLENFIVVQIRDRGNTNIDEPGAAKRSENKVVCLGHFSTPLF